MVPAAVGRTEPRVTYAALSTNVGSSARGQEWPFLAILAPSEAILRCCGDATDLLRPRNLAGRMTSGFDVFRVPVDQSKDH